MVSTDTFVSGVREGGAHFNQLGTRLKWRAEPWIVELTQNDGHPAGNFDSPAKV
jgi:hypothetical protein